MAPTRATAQNARATRSASKIKLVSSSVDMDDPEDVRSDSNDSTVEQVALLAQRMVNSIRERREVRRKELSAKFLRDASELEENIVTTFESLYKSKITKQHIERLSVLVKRKAALEEKILFCVTKLEKSYMNANREVHVTISGRRNDIEAMKNIHVGQPEKHLELS